MLGALLWYQVPTRSLLRGDGWWRWGWSPWHHIRNMISVDDDKAKEKESITTTAVTKLQTL